MIRFSRWIFMTVLFLSCSFAYAQEASQEAVQAAEPESAELSSTDKALDEAAIKSEIKQSLKKELREELREEIKAEIIEEMKAEEAAKMEAEKQAAEKEKQEKPKEEKPGEAFLTSVGNIFKLYGFLRLDVAYDTSRTNWGNWMLFVKPNKSYQKITENGIERIRPNNDGMISITPRLTRFGIKMKGQKINTIKADLSGVLELDFYGGDIRDVGGPSPDWKALPRWRQAYLALSWDFLEIRIGQTWDILSPLIPRIDYTGGSWWFGNTGGRRPQLQLNFKPEVAKGHRIFAQLSIARPGAIDGNDYDVTIDENGDKSIGDGNNDGLDSGIPQIQWRLAYHGKPYTEKKELSIGISGHLENYEARNRVWNDNQKRYNQSGVDYIGYSINADVQIPFVDWWVLRGEVFWGQNVKSIWGGIGQAVNPESLDADGAPQSIKSLGFWVDTTVKPVDFYQVTVGYMMDWPDDSTMPDASIAQMEKMRWKNQAAYISNEFILGSGFTIGLEYLYAMTDYKFARDLTAETINVETYSAVNHRIKTYFMYSF